MLLDQIFRWCSALEYLYREKSPLDRASQSRKAGG